MPKSITFLLQIKLQDLGHKTLYFLSFANFALALGDGVKILHCLLVVVQNHIMNNLNGEVV